jgi:hypothetical protein
MQELSYPDGKDAAMSNVTFHIRAWLAVLLVTLIPNTVAVQGQSRPTDNEQPPDGALDLYWRLVAERQAKIAEMWETGKFETDSGGIIPMSVLAQGRALGGPVWLDPLRRNEFDAWCERMELIDTVPSETIETIWQNYVNQINRVLLEKYPPVFDLSALAVAEPPPWSRASAAAYEEAMNLFKVVRRDVARTEDQMFRMLATVDQGRFAPQVESWQRYRSWARSMQSLHPAVSGSAIHLSRLLDGLEIDWPNAHVQHAYEMEIASTVERLVSHRISASAQLIAFEAEGFFDARDERYEGGSPEAIAAFQSSREASRPIYRQRLRLERAIYAVNARYLTLLSVLLDSTDAERVFDTFAYEAYGPYFPNPYDLRPWFDQLLDDNAASAKLKGAVNDLRQTYLMVQRGVDDSLIRAIHDHDAELIIERGFGPTPDERKNRQDRQIEYELQRRYENTVIFAIRLVELVNDDERFAWVQEKLEAFLETSLDRQR